MELSPSVWALVAAVALVGCWDPRVASGGIFALALSRWLQL